MKFEGVSKGEVEKGRSVSASCSRTGRVQSKKQIASSSGTLLGYANGGSGKRIASRGERGHTTEDVPRTAEGLKVWSFLGIRMRNETAALQRWK